LVTHGVNCGIGREVRRVMRNMLVL
jgi:hypothetical protein